MRKNKASHSSLAYVPLSRAAIKRLNNLRLSLREKRHGNGRDPAEVFHEAMDREIALALRQVNGLH